MVSEVDVWHAANLLIREHGAGSIGLAVVPGRVGIGYADRVAPYSSTTMNRILLRSKLRGPRAPDKLVASSVRSRSTRT
jgi:hypothetical protein